MVVSVARGRRGWSVKKSNSDGPSPEASGCERQIFGLIFTKSNMLGISRENRAQPQLAAAGQPSNSKKNTRVEIQKFRDRC